MKNRIYNFESDKLFYRENTQIYLFAKKCLANDGEKW